jgi:hypothetical protein
MLRPARLRTRSLPRPTPSGTVAYISTNAIVQADNSVAVRAREDLIFHVIVGDAAGGVGALGASIAIVNINTNTEAYIDSNAEVSAGTGGSDNVTVSAIATDHTEGHAYAGPRWPRRNWCSGRFDYRQQHAIRSH